ncbi:MAG: oxidoreductase, partial [bacterium]
MRSIVAAIEGAGCTAFAFQANAADPASQRAGVEQAGAALGGLDILVHSAFADPGIENSPPFWAPPLSWYDTLRDVGTRGAYTAAAGAVPLMLG